MGIKKIKQQHGFTIIELSLFLAVSGLLLTAMLTGIGLAVQQQRFTDAVNGTQSFLQQQYNETQITINDRGATSDCGSLAKGTSDCLVIGKIIDLGIPSASAQDATINSYRVIVDQAGVDTASKSTSPSTDLEYLNNQVTGAHFNTTAIKDSSNDQQYIVPWGAKLGTIQDSSGNPAPTPTGSNVSTIRYILLLRSPVNGLISTYTINTTVDFFVSSNTQPLSTENIRAFNGTSNQSIKACIQSADLSNAKALLKVAPGGSQDAVTTQSDTPEKVAWCP